MKQALNILYQIGIFQANQGANGTEVQNIKVFYPLVLGAPFTASLSSDIDPLWPLVYVYVYDHFRGRHIQMTNFHYVLCICLTKVSFCM